MIQPEQLPDIPDTLRDRLFIKEARARFREKHGRRIEVAEIAAAVFTDAETIDRSEARKHQIISRWNNGHAMKMATPHRLVRLAQVLDTSVEKLLTGE